MMILSLGIKGIHPIRTFQFDLMGGFTQALASCDNVYVFLFFCNKLTEKLIVVNWEWLKCLANFLSINLYFLNLTFICIYNISRG